MITHRTQLAPKPSKLLPELAAPSGIDEFAKGPQVGAQPPDGDSSLVDRLDAATRDRP